MKLKKPMFVVKIVLLILVLLAIYYGLLCFVGYMNKLDEDAGKAGLNLSLLNKRITDLEDVIKELETKSVLDNVREVDVTAYTLSKKECGKDFGFTASMEKPKPGMIAVSRDLLEKGWTFGKKVYIEGVGIFTIADLIHGNHTNRIDVLMFDKKAAKKLGFKKNVTAAIIRK